MREVALFFGLAFLFIFFFGLSNDCVVCGLGYWDLKRLGFVWSGFRCCRMNEKLRIVK